MFDVNNRKIGDAAWILWCSLDFTPWELAKSCAVSKSHGEDLKTPPCIHTVTHEQVSSKFFGDLHSHSVHAIIQGPVACGALGKGILS
jgi:hypothetical protein